MSNLSLAKRLRNKEILVSSMLTINAPEIIEILSKSDFDWVFIDSEHSAITTSDIQNLIMISDGKIPSVIRLPAHDEVWIKKVLDAGADGLIFPKVSTRQQAENIIQMTKYPPLGSRGIGIARAQGYGAEFASYVKTANKETAVVIQIEDSLGVENIEEISEVEGIDCIYIGPYDLSGSLGVLGKVEHPKVRNAIEKVINAAKKREIALGYFGVSVESTLPYIKEGFTFFTIGVDSSLLLNTTKSIVKDFRSSTL